MLGTEQILDLAARVRKASVQFVCSSECDPTADYFRDRSLGCFCAVASSTLQNLLRKNGVPATFISGHFDDGEDDHDSENHCWVEVQGHILDITATQFDPRLPAIVFLPRKSEAASRWHLCRRIRKIQDLGFPNEQMPNSKIENAIQRRIDDSRVSSVL